MATCYKLEVTAINATKDGIKAFTALNEVAALLHKTELYYDTEKDLRDAVEEYVKTFGPVVTTFDKHNLRFEVINFQGEVDEVERRLTVFLLTPGGLDKIGTVDLRESEVAKYVARPAYDRFFSKGSPVDMDIVKDIHNNTGILPVSFSGLEDMVVWRATTGSVCDHDINTDIITVTTQIGNTRLFIARQYHRK